MPRGLKVLTIITAVLFAAVTVFLFAVTPMERSMGLVQKVFYYHFSNAVIGMVGFIVVAVVGAIYLNKRDLKWDRLAVAMVEVSMVYFLIAILSGMIWAYPAWNTWWTWDPRLTTAAILEMAYVAYLLLRRGIEEPERRARFSAVYSIAAVLSVPLTYFSTTIFRTIHPKLESFNMSPVMVVTMVSSLVVFALLWVTLVWWRLSLGGLAAEIEQKRQERTA